MTVGRRWLGHGEWPGGDWRSEELGQPRAENPVDINRPDGSTVSAVRAILDLPVAPEETLEEVTLIVVGLTADQIPPGSRIVIRPTI